MLPIVPTLSERDIAMMHPVNYCTEAESGLLSLKNVDNSLIFVFNKKKYIINKQVADKDRFEGRKPAEL